MKFIHLSTKKFEKFITPRTLGKGYKPINTLWVAKDNEWEDWLKDGTMSKDEIEKLHKYEFDIDITKVIKLSTYEDVSSFNSLFGIRDPLYKKHYIIDWNKVKKDTGKSGVYVENAYIKNARKDFPWYSTFDIESIAIWKKDCIISTSTS